MPYVNILKRQMVAASNHPRPHFGLPRMETFGRKDGNSSVPWARATAAVSGARAAISASSAHAVGTTPEPPGRGAGHRVICFIAKATGAGDFVRLKKVINHEIKIYF